jgi:hypothetical protein
MSKEIVRMIIIYDDGSSIELHDGKTGRRDKAATEGWLK